METKEQFAEIMAKLGKLVILEDINNRLGEMEKELVSIKTKTDELETANAFASEQIEALKEEKVNKAD